MSRVAFVTGGNSRDRCGDQQGVEAGGLQGRGDLCRQRRGGREVQGRDGNRGLQMGRQSFDACVDGRQEGRGRARPDRRPRQQCRHHPRRRFPQDDRRAVERGDRHQPRLAVQRDPAGDRRHARPQVRPHHQHLARSTARRASSARSTTRPRRPATSASPRRWRWRMRAAASPSTAICPGYIDTEMVQAVPKEVLEKIIAAIPVGRLGEPEEIARGVVFLAADEAGFITGSTLSINGGQLSAEPRRRAPRAAMSVRGATLIGLQRDPDVVAAGGDDGRHRPHSGVRTVGDDVCDRRLGVFGAFRAAPGRDRRAEAIAARLGGRRRRAVRLSRAVFPGAAAGAAGRGRADRTISGRC